MGHGPFVESKVGQLGIRDFLERLGMLQVYMNLSQLEDAFVGIGLPFLVLGLRSISPKSS